MNEIHPALLVEFPLSECSFSLVILVCGIQHAVLLCDNSLWFLL